YCRCHESECRDYQTRNHAEAVVSPPDASADEEADEHPTYPFSVRSSFQVNVDSRLGENESGSVRARSCPDASHDLQAFKGGTARPGTRSTRPGTRSIAFQLS